MVFHFGMSLGLKALRFLSQIENRIVSTPPREEGDLLGTMSARKNQDAAITVPLSRFKTEFRLN